MNGHTTLELFVSMKENRGLVVGEGREREGEGLEAEEDRVVMLESERICVVQRARTGPSTSEQPSALLLGREPFLKASFSPVDRPSTHLQRE